MPETKPLRLWLWGNLKYGKKKKKFSNGSSDSGLSYLSVSTTAPLRSTSSPISCRRSPALIWYPIKSPRMHISSIRHRSLSVIRLNLIFHLVPSSLVPPPLCFHPAHVSPGTPRKSRMRSYQAEYLISWGAMGSTHWNIIFIFIFIYFWILFLFLLCFQTYWGVFSDLLLDCHSTMLWGSLCKPRPHTHTRAMKSCPVRFQHRLFLSSVRERTRGHSEISWRSNWGEDLGHSWRSYLALCQIVGKSTICCVVF